MPPELSITDESGGFFSSSNKLNYELCKSLEERVRLIGMRDKLDGREEIQREDTHDGFRIDNVSALNKIHVVICKDNHVNKFSDILNVAELDFSFFHFAYYFFSKYKSEFIFWVNLSWLYICFN